MSYNATCYDTFDTNSLTSFEWMKRTTIREQQIHCFIRLFWSRISSPSQEPDEPLHSVITRPLKYFSNTFGNNNFSFCRQKILQNMYVTLESDIRKILYNNTTTQS